MTRFLAFVRKEFYHILRDPRTLLILFGLPFVQVLLFGFALTNEIKNANIALLDLDHGTHSQQIISRLLSSGYFRLSQNLSSYPEAEKVFRKGKVKLVVVFPPRFSQDIAHLGTARVQLLADASEQNTAISLSEYASNIINTYAQNLNQQPAALQIVVEPRMVFNPELKGAFVFVPGVMAMVLLVVSALMTSVTIAREKETGTMEILLVSPLSQWQIIMGKVLPYLSLSFFNGGLIIALGIGLLGIPMNGSVTFLLCAMLLFIFVALSLGIFISTIADSQLVAMFVSMIVLLLPTIFLSGFIFPIESMPPPLQIISRILPASHFILLVKGIMIQGAGLRQLWPHIVVLLAYSVVLMYFSFRNLKPRLSA